MTTTLYKVHNNSSQRKIKSALNENGVEHTERNIRTQPIRKDELFSILERTDYGVEELISPRAKKTIEELAEEGVIIDDLSISEFHEVIQKFPSILRTPILVHGDVLMVGYDEDEIDVLKSRESRKEELNVVLEQLRENDDAYEMSLKFGDNEEEAI